MLHGAPAWVDRAGPRRGAVRSQCGAPVIQYVKIRVEYPSGDIILAKLMYKTQFDIQRVLNGNISGSAYSGLCSVSHANLFSLSHSLVASIKNLHNHHQEFDMIQEVAVY